MGISDEQKGGGGIECSIRGDVGRVGGGLVSWGRGVGGEEEGRRKEVRREEEGSKSEGRKEGGKQRSQQIIK